MQVCRHQKLLPPVFWVVGVIGNHLEIALLVRGQEADRRAHHHKVRREDRGRDRVSSKQMEHVDVLAPAEEVEGVVDVAEDDKVLERLERGHKQVRVEEGAPDQLLLHPLVHIELGPADHAWVRALGDKQVAFELTQRRDRRLDVVEVCRREDELQPERRPFLVPLLANYSRDLQNVDPPCLPRRVHDDSDSSFTNPVPTTT
mmetsp:Transcript_59200/g.139489  ORF Transcript_59200/g.139489 Transcript_59200/m.139489 type:complete len:202 (+) Transcript_59200:471-1076(+)